MKKMPGKYAKALFSLDTTADEKLMHAHALKEIAHEMKDNADSLNFFQNPFIPIEEKKQLLSKSLGSPPDNLLLNFLELLIKVRRFKDLPDISTEFKNMVNLSNNITEATLIFAAKTDEKTRDFFKEKLEKRFKTKLEITEKIDPEILGGFILIIAGKIIDQSIKGKLNSLKERFYSQKI